MNLIWINKAQYLGDYRLALSFSNGEERVLTQRILLPSTPPFMYCKIKNVSNNLLWMAGLSHG